MFSEISWISIFFKINLEYDIYFLIGKKYNVDYWIQISEFHERITMIQESSKLAKITSKQNSILDCTQVSSDTREWLFSLNRNSSSNFRVQSIRVVERLEDTKTMRLRKRWIHVTIVRGLQRLSVLFTLCEIAEASALNQWKTKPTRATDLDYTCRFSRPIRPDERRN